MQIFFYNAKERSQWIVKTQSAVLKFEQTAENKRLYRVIIPYGISYLQYEYAIYLNRFLRDITIHRLVYILYIKMIVYHL